MAQNQPIKDLHIVVKKIFFDEIKSGKKTIEYRDITHYWAVRLVDDQGYFKQFDKVIFHLGMTNNTIEKKHIKTTDKKNIFAIYFE